MLVRMEEKRNPCTLLVESKLMQLLWRSVLRFLKKLKLELPYAPAVPFLGIYVKECKSAHNGDTYTPVGRGEVTKMFWNFIMVTIVQLSEYIQNHWIFSIQE
jgi:hypothetical protein